MQDKTTFGSKIGLIAATVGSAVGLGNVWRFPAETQANGGAAFLLIYVFCVFLLGIPVMLGEFTLGRGGKSDAVGVYRHFAPKKPWWMAGAVATSASYLILCFYMVVAGWTLEYLIKSLTGELYTVVPEVAGASGIEAYDIQFTARMHEYISDGLSPIIYTYLLILINLGVLLLGVKKGIERLSNILMPLLFALLVVFCLAAFTLPKASEGLNFFLNPDFSKITPKVFIDALGQAFFSLSLGMGILVTYSSYFPKSTNLTRTAVTVSLLDLLVAVMMGLIIFPAVMSFGLEDHTFEGVTLVFVTLPEVFTQMPGTQLWSVLFFLLLLVAAVTSTISIAEVTVAFFRDRFGMKRRNACLVVILPLFIFSAVCSLSNGPWSDFRIYGMTIFDFLDTFATNILLPVGAIIMSIFLGWFAPENLLYNQLTNHGTINSRLLPAIIFILKWFAPVAITVILIARFI